MDCRRTNYLKATPSSVKITKSLTQKVKMLTNVPFTESNLNFSSIKCYLKI